MPGRNGQRKTGTARGWPRRSRTAEASHISRCAVKLRCAREWGGWGRLSDDGRDSITRTGARAPGVGGAFHRMAVQYIASTDPTLGGSTLKHEGRRQTGRRTVYAGSRLKLTAVPGRSRLIRQPSSRNGENPPCGMIGGTMETAASFEARNAPSSYPTPLVLEASRDQCLTKVTHYRRNQGVLRLHSPTPPLSMPVLLRRAIRRSQDSLHQ